jgi:hypothetical protein
MEEYQRLDPYSRSRYEHGIDSKIVIMGNSGTSIRFPLDVCSCSLYPTGVGKTSLLYRYTQNKFDPKNTTSTSGAFFVTKKVYVNGLKVRLQLWDTAGQERFRSMVSFLSSISSASHWLTPPSGTYVLPRLVLLFMNHVIWLVDIAVQVLMRLCYYTTSQMHPRSRTFADGYKVTLVQCPQIRS